MPKEMVVNKGRVPLDNVQVSLVVVVILMVIMVVVGVVMVVMVVDKVKVSVDHFLVSLMVGQGQ